MVASEFISQIQSFNVVKYVGLEDFADKFSFCFTFIVLFIAFSIVSAKQYVLEGLSCYVATPFGGSNFGEYMNNYCWINGTLPLKYDAKLLVHEEYWRQLEPKKMNYYQWVPLVLGFQAVLCYLPRLIWQTVTFNRVGADLTQILEAASKGSSQTGDDRKSTVEQVAITLESLLFSRRAIRPNSRLHKARQSIWLMWLPGKRLGTAIVFYYMIIKMLYLLNAVGQLVMMQRFLNMDGQYTFFGLAVAGDLIQGRHWNETMVFPRIGHCRVEFQHVGKVNSALAQCALPINMLNEKIYIFLWFWFVLAALLEVISIMKWCRLLLIKQQRLHSIIRYLKIANIYIHEMAPIVERFEENFLKMDGNFLVHMMHVNCGEIITKEIVEKMLNRFIQHQEEETARLEKLQSEVSTPLANKIYSLTTPDDSTVFRRILIPDKGEFV